MRVWDVGLGAAVGCFTGHTHWVSAVDLDERGKVRKSYCGRIKRYLLYLPSPRTWHGYTTTATPKKTLTCPLFFLSLCLLLLFSKKNLARPGQTALSGDHAGVVKLWNLPLPGDAKQAVRD